MLKFYHNILGANLEAKNFSGDTPLQNLLKKIVDSTDEQVRWQQTTYYIPRSLKKMDRYVTENFFIQVVNEMI